MNFTYSTEADALYIELESAKSVARTVEVSPSCLVDLDEAGRPLGIELIHPSRTYLALAKVVNIWSLDQQSPQLLAYPYQSLTPRRRSASTAARGRVEIDGRKDELLTGA
jgi:uncharacterized protein YuzE